MTLAMVSVGGNEEYMFSTLNIRVYIYTQLKCNTRDESEWFGGGSGAIHKLLPIRAVSTTQVHGVRSTEYYIQHEIHCP